MTQDSTRQKAESGREGEGAVDQPRLVHPWPAYDEDADPNEDETAMLFYLESMANPEVTCQEIADKLNATFGNNRTADEVQAKLLIGN